MCNAISDDLQLEDGLKNLKINRKICGKCAGSNGQPIVYIRKDDPPLCKECFLSQTVHKLRSAFGKNNVIKSGDKVCMAFSGGSHSCSLLRMIHECNSSNKRLRFVPHLIHLVYDENSAQKAKVFAQDLDFEIQLVPIPENSPLLKIKQFFAENQHNSSLSALEYFERWLKLKFLCQITESLDTKYLLTAECSNRLAVECLAGLVQGRGSNCSSEIAFSDVRFGSVTLVRPLYEMLATQVLFYLKLKELSPVNCLDSISDIVLSSDKPVSTIDRKSEELISYLQFGNFPSSVFNILRIASKLSDNSESYDRKCSICAASFSLQQDPHKLASDALDFSNSLCQPIDAPSSSLVDTPHSHQFCHACTINFDQLSTSMRSIFRDL
ncbi:Cytoplasmic tRNA 2-thiolation protein 2 [Cichlidogyrus casuarinus]|uniref:Cytoplasmic tRNA 2-thiolation protein 2 n=1 Tax=Cichlidogyrus casuarinus TaxID=1844966 RepID=A0ABD2Q1T5_9PLAT